MAGQLANLRKSVRPIVAGASDHVPCFHSIPLWLHSITGLTSQKASQKQWRSSRGSFASPHARPMGRACGAAGQVKEIEHPGLDSPLSLRRRSPLAWGVLGTASLVFAAAGCVAPAWRGGRARRRAWALRRRRRSLPPRHAFCFLLLFTADVAAAASGAGASTDTQHHACTQPFHSARLHGPQRFPLQAAW